MTPPGPPPSSSERVEVTGNFVEQHLVPSVGSLKYVISRTLQRMYCVPVLLEVAVILAGNFSNAPLAPWVLRTLLPPGGLRALTFTAPFVIGWALNLAGTLLRIHCYRTLDRLFTFELAVQREHKLVTDGVYSIVRHPSYTAAIIMFFGCFAVQLFPGSWLHEYVGFALTAGWVMIQGALLTVGVCERMPREDDMLRKEFGQQWDEWAKRVPYRLIPGIL
ncbi:hypothetical protein HDZ31DRAFT_28824 [Schizophyllum fasciatum]